MEMPLPDNTLPMMTGFGQFGPLEMGGMFTVVKVREGLAADDYKDPGPYKIPAGHRRLRIQRRCRRGAAAKRARGTVAAQASRQTSLGGDGEESLPTNVWARSSAWPALRFRRSRALFAEASAHDAHEHFAAGEPGDPKKPFRIVKVTMLEDGKKMLFEPAVVDVRLGEQVRFEIFNEGSWNHEFVLATEAANRKHAEADEEISRHGARRSQRRTAIALRSRRDPLEIHQAWGVRICLPHSRPS